jgi:hypothetical protein
MDETASGKCNLIAGMATAKVKVFININSWAWLWSSPLQPQFFA